MKYVASMTDANLHGEVKFFAPDVATIEDIIVRRGLWTDLPYTRDSKVLLNSPTINVWLNPAPHYADDTPERKVDLALEYGWAREYEFSVGPRGGIKRVHLP